MANSERRQRGLEVMKKVYAGDVPVPPEGTLDFADIMLEQLFAEVWSREALSIRDRRMLLLGAIAALGEKDVFRIQARAALKNDELSPEQLREVVIHMVQYAGYPRVSGLVAVVESEIAELESKAAR